ncbi:MAG: branched-chain amino acid ABC transporter permease [Sphaerochaetaceae bacterium]|nr:branched-chain amino acid ABC transporter permease [Sphaerochaetaceae bacterium]
MLKDKLMRSFFVSLWFAVLTFPIMVVRVNTIEDTVTWRWGNLIMVLFGSFVLSFLWSIALERKSTGSKKQTIVSKTFNNLRATVSDNRNIKLALVAIILLFVVIFPFITSFYQMSIMNTALMYVMLGLGLNIVIGLGGILHLGYIAFFLVGSYSYALLNIHFGLNFWLALPIGGFLALILGILIAVPVLRLRGDYLAIVTLAFGEITRIVVENWSSLTGGPSGIRSIPRPAIPGLDLNLTDTAKLVYFIMIVLAALTIFITIRLKDSRIGRALIAMREDEIACQSMGINTTRMKVIAFALGSVFAGVAGVVFAANTTFINPASFTIWESVMVLLIVVLGGMGSIPGVVVAALVIKLLPEYLRAFSQYRMLVFGAVLIIMMIFKPDGLLPEKRKHYSFTDDDKAEMKAEGK